VLPWRAGPGEKPDPYRVWLSEIMLQQTTVRAVAPYYARFLARFPTVERLAAAPLDDVLKAWAGLGYYARARHLHACARAVTERGRFPDTEEALRALPGIGAYTAAAIAAIAFDRRASPVDGNVERVMARLHAVEAPLPAAKPVIRRLAEALTPAGRAGDFAQAMMDLGATICTPKPACFLCPWSDPCAARRRGDPELFPRKVPKVEGRLRRGAAFVVVRADGFVLTRTRPAKGLLGGMTEVPTTAWTHDFDEGKAYAEAPRFLPLPKGERACPGLDPGSARQARRVGGRIRVKPPMRLPPHPDPLPNGERKIAWRRIPGLVTHTFTHFPLELIVYRGEVSSRVPAPAGTRWVAAADLAGEAFPNVMRKVLAHALGL